VLTPRFNAAGKVWPRRDASRRRRGARAKVARYKKRRGNGDSIDPRTRPVVSRPGKLGDEIHLAAENRWQTGEAVLRDLDRRSTVPKVAG
jgi:hypothetical protein